MIGAFAFVAMVAAFAVIGFLMMAFLIKLEPRKQQQSDVNTVSSSTTQSAHKSKSNTTKIDEKSKQLYETAEILVNETMNTAESKHKIRT